MANYDSGAPRRIANPLSEATLDQVSRTAAKINCLACDNCAIAATSPTRTETTGTILRAHSRRQVLIKKVVERGNACRRRVVMRCLTSGTLAREASQHGKPPFMRCAYKPGIVRLTVRGA